MWDKTSESVSVGPRFGVLRVGWCGPCLCLRGDGLSRTGGGGVVGPAEVEGREVVTHPLIAQTAHVHQHSWK